MRRSGDHKALSTNSSLVGTETANATLLRRSWPISTGTRRPTVALARMEMISSTGRRPSWARCVAFLSASRLVATLNAVADLVLAGAGGWCSRIAHTPAECSS